MLPFEDVHFIRQDARLQLPNVPFAVGYSHRHPHVIRREDSFCTSFEYCLSGRLNVSVNGRSFSVSPGDIYILPHQSRYECSSPEADRTRKIYLYFSRREIAHLLSLYGLSKIYYFPNCTPVSSWFRSSVTLARRFERERTAAARDVLISELSSNMNRILAVLAQYARTTSGISGDVLAMMDFIDTHLHEQITLTDIALAIGKSVPHAIRLFKRATGGTPHDHLIQRRIETASFLLNNTADNIRTIAMRAGFKNEHYFSSVFKERTGRPPSSLRDDNGTSQ